MRAHACACVCTCDTWRAWLRQWCKMSRRGRSVRGNGQSRFGCRFGAPHSWREPPGKISCFPHAVRQPLRARHGCGRPRRRLVATGQGLHAGYGPARPRRTIVVVTCASAGTKTDTIRRGGGSKKPHDPAHRVVTSHIGFIRSWRFGVSSASWRRSSAQFPVVRNLGLLRPRPPWIDIGPCELPPRAHVRSSLQKGGRCATWHQTCEPSGCSAILPLLDRIWGATPSFEARVSTRLGHARIELWRSPHADTRETGGHLPRVGRARRVEQVRRDEALRAWVTVSAYPKRMVRLPSLG